MQLARQQIGVDARAALVRDVLQLDAGHLCEECGGKVRCRPFTDRPVVELPGPGLGVRDQFSQGAHRQLPGDDHVERRGEQLGDQGEFLGGVGQRPPQRRVQHQAGRARDEERVAIRRGLGQGLGADDLARTGDVLHHHRLADLRAEAGGERPRRQVARPSGGIGDDDAHLPGRPGLRRCDRRGQQRDGEDPKPRQRNAGHAYLLGSRGIIAPRSRRARRSTRSCTCASSGRRSAAARSGCCA